MAPKTASSGERGDSGYFSVNSILFIFRGCGIWPGFHIVEGSVRILLNNVTRIAFMIGIRLRMFNVVFV